MKKIKLARKIQWNLHLTSRLKAAVQSGLSFVRRMLSQEPLDAPEWEPGEDGLPPVALQHTWFELTRVRPWQSLALVPCERGRNVLPLAQQLAEMASRDPERRVLLVNASHEAYAAAGALRENASGEARGYDYKDFSGSGVAADELGLVHMPQLLRDARASQDSPGGYNTIIVALDDVAHTATAVPVARAVDAVALCVFLGRDRILSARRAVTLIGKDQIVGSIAVTRSAVG